MPTKLRTFKKVFGGRSTAYMVGNTVNIVFCFGPRLRLKTEVWAQAEQYLKNEKEEIITGKSLPFRP